MCPITIPGVLRILGSVQMDYVFLQHPISRFKWSSREMQPASEPFLYTDVWYKEVRSNAPTTCSRVGGLPAHKVDGFTAL